MTESEYPHPGSSGITAWAQANVRANTKPEVLIRSLLHRRGRRFRKHLAIEVPVLKVRSAIVFTRKGLALFVDGCFWHGWPIHGGTPKTNASYWQQKRGRNARRDRLVNEKLESAGWSVLRIWEHIPAGE